MAFSPDKHTLATGSSDHTAILWDVSNPTHTHPLGQPLAGHTSDVQAMQFPPTDKR